MADCKVNDRAYTGMMVEDDEQAGGASPHSCASHHNNLVEINTKDNKKGPDKMGNGTIGNNYKRIVKL